MALTRKKLKALGIGEDIIEEIIEEHAETVNALREQANANSNAAQELATTKAELDTLKQGDWKAKYEKEHSDFESYKTSQTEKETKTAKETAVRAYFESKGIKGNNLNIALRGCQSELGAIEIADGKIKDSAALDALVKGDFAGLITSTEKSGAGTPTPPEGNGGKFSSKDDIMKIKDSVARQKAIAENIELFRS